MLTKNMWQKCTIFVLLFLLVGVVSGCSLSFEKWGKKADEVIEENVDKEKIEKKVEKAKEYGLNKFDELVKDMEAFDMQKIDQWVEDNNLNEYGDEIDKIYKKGSPLIEAPGKVKGKYEYILEQHPDLIDELKLKIPE